jgi:hypothetical protein
MVWYLVKHRGNFAFILHVTSVTNILLKAQGWLAHNELVYKDIDINLLRNSISYHIIMFKRMVMQ